MDLNEYIKKVLDNRFSNYSISGIQGGNTEANLFRISCRNESYILKTQNSGLKHEYLNYKWLEGKVPVPKVKFYYSGKCEMLCMSELVGNTLEYYINKADPREIVILYAAALKLLHSVAPDKLALRQDLKNRIAKAKYNVENHLIDILSMQYENQSVEPSKLFAKLISLTPEMAYPVFTHGDYCFDNIIFNGKILSGFIDMGNGGVGDKYQDIALASRNITDFFGNEYLPLFYEHYGLEDINKEKIDFYILLDEFF